MFRVYPEPRRANPTRSLYPVYAACPVYAEPRKDPRREPQSEPRSERTRRTLRALCVSAFSSLSLFSFRNLQTFQLTNLSISPRANSHRITSFAHPHPLTPIESHLCKKQGGGVPLSARRGRRASCLCVTRRNPNNSNPFMGLLHNSRTPRGGGACFQRREVQFSSQCPRVTEHRSRDSVHGPRLTTHHSLPTTHSQPLKPPLQMAHPYTCTRKKGPAAREPRYSPCAAS
jgi:hypothetical protein